MMKSKNLVFPALLCAVAAVQAGEPASEARLDEVARRGAQVMSFDLERTTHVFTQTGQGGVQQVIAKDPADAELIGLIRVHLAKISRQFARGDFFDPVSIHGEDMPGLAELRQAEPGRIKIDYRELPAGAEIVYSAKTPALADAIHRWFDAQLSDHARHAIGGHSLHSMHGR